MKEILREAVAGLVLRVARGMVFLLMFAGMFRRNPPVDHRPLPPPIVATQPTHRLTPDESVLTRTAGDVERLVNRKLGWQ